MVASNTKGTARCKVPPKPLLLTLDYLKERKAVININNFNIEKSINSVHRGHVADQGYGTYNTTQY